MQKLNQFVTQCSVSEYAQWKTWRRDKPKFEIIAYFPRARKENLFKTEKYIV